MTPQSFHLGARRHPRRMSLTPMIDVVFLLLIFFMLASRFGMDAVLPVVTAGPASGEASDWQGAPRLVDLTPDGLALNGVALPDSGLAPALRPLLPDADAPVVIRARDGADVQRLVDVIDLIRREGLGRPVLVE
ncbi:biopolymer transporter ExbD [Paracoccus sp. M683]|uniref:ExbD/TolR family protein n=1 Tax=Paracoccus sp. M683 TaxID=2594268 RepID=UPI00117F1BD5|nr:biopolymer transporter ExbD [Paracoccus sp. M683]TRW96009.1 biopolymer transporter ExbD [Paracoccus sp. M683]